MRNGIQAKIGATLERKVYAVDLFCGAGGLTHGLMKAGVDVRLGPVNTNFANNFNR